jgi:predicted TIM-barrel fold metal-dependent hydrolase
MAKSYTIISADAHLEIPPEMWVHRVPALYRDYAPRRVKLANGGDGFLVEGMPIYYGGMNLFAGKDPKDFSPIGLTWDSPGTGPADQRLREQDLDGVDAEVLFPGVGARNLLRGIRNRNAYLAILRAYNDYLVEEYCAVDPDRLIGLGVIPETSLEDALAELEHCKQQGFKGINLSAFPSGRLYPTPDDDRFWAAALEMDMPVTIHVRFDKPSRGEPVFKFPKEPEPGEQPHEYVERLYRYGIRGAMNCMQLVMAGVYDRFPRLGIYWAESQLGWIPLYLEQADNQYLRHYHWAERLLGAKPLRRLPSEYIKEHNWWGFFNDKVGIRLRHDVRVDRIMWGGDFPHVESDWPHSRELLAEHFANVPEDERRKIVRDNAVDFFHLATAQAAPQSSRASAAAG